MTRPVSVVHSVHRWLPRTMNWLHQAIIRLPVDIQSRVVCTLRDHPDEFPVAGLQCHDDAGFFFRLSERALEKMTGRPRLPLLTRTLKSPPTDIVHSHFGNIGWRDATIVRRAGCRHVVSFYGFDLNRLPTMDSRWAGRYRQLFEGVDRVLCLGPWMRANLERMGCPAEKIIIHHLGVDLSKIPFSPRTWDSSEPLRVLMCGTFREKKGMPDALRALARLKERVPIRATIIGEASVAKQEQAERVVIMNTIKELALSEDVRLLGFRPYDFMLEEAYRNHVFLSPSRIASDGDTEGTPITIIEMAASGMPIVSTRHADIPEIVVDEETGLLAEERDVDGIVDRLARLTEHPESWNAMLVASRQHVESRFSAAVQAEELATIYRNLVPAAER